MNLKCPHCRCVNEYLKREIRIYVTCRNCHRQFRPWASVPIISQRSSSGVAEENPGDLASARGFAGSEEWVSLTRRGLDLFDRQMYDDAEKELRKSLRINPRQPAVPRILRSIQGMRRHLQATGSS